MLGKIAPLTKILLAFMVVLHAIGMIGTALGWSIVSQEWFIHQFGLSFQSPFFTYSSYAFIHSNLLHIGFNMMFFAMLGSAVERELGAKGFLIFSVLAAIISGAAALWLSFFFGKYILLIGYSGVIFAYLGLYFGSAILRARDQVTAFKKVVKDNWALVVYLFIPLVLPLGISGEAHLFGLLFGGAMAWYRAA